MNKIFTYENSMTQEETINRNIGLTFDFVNYLLDNPKELDKLPDNFVLEFRENDVTNF
jgi:hypothetical protein